VVGIRDRGVRGVRGVTGMQVEDGDLKVLLC
jgi:hypothetical protein